MTAEPGSSKSAAAPLEKPARAELPPRPLSPPLACPVSHVDRVVVELDVEVAGGDVGAVDEDQLEAVELVGLLAEVADVEPVDAEGRRPSTVPCAVLHDADAARGCRRRRRTAR